MCYFGSCYDIEGEPEGRQELSERFVFTAEKKQKWDNRITAVVDLTFGFLLFQYVMFPRVAMWPKAATLVLLMIEIYLQLDGKFIFTRNSLLIALYILFNIVSTIIGIKRG